MSAPYLSRAEREAVVKVLRAAGYEPDPGQPNVWWCVDCEGERYVDLALLFPEPCPERADHQVRYDSGPAGNWAYCSCGWRGQTCSSADLAEDDGWAHAAREKP